MPQPSGMTAFLGFFRLGELLVKSKLAYNPSIDLRWGDVSSTLALQHQWWIFTLKTSKCDQFGMGTDILLGHTECTLCPVMPSWHSFVYAGTTHLAASSSTARKKTIMQSRFVSRVRKVLLKAGFAEEQFTGHSFRIGAATSVELADIEDSIIQALGSSVPPLHQSSRRHHRGISKVDRVRTQYMICTLHACILCCHILCCSAALYMLCRLSI